MVRSDVGRLPFAKFRRLLLGVLENFGPNIGQPQASRRTFEQADAELIFEVGNAGG